MKEEVEIIRFKTKQFYILSTMILLSTLVFAYFLKPKYLIAVVALAFAFLIENTLSKRIGQIQIKDSEMVIDYINKFLKKRYVFHPSEVVFEFTSEVHFRGGKVDELTVKSLRSNKILIKVEKRSFLNAEDFEYLVKNYVVAS